MYIIFYLGGQQQGLQQLQHGEEQHPLHPYLIDRKDKELTTIQWTVDCLLQTKIRVVNYAFYVLNFEPTQHMMIIKMENWGWKGSDLVRGYITLENLERKFKMQGKVQVIGKIWEWWEVCTAGRVIGNCEQPL